MHRVIAAIASLGLLTSCSYIHINRVPSEPPASENERTAYLAKCVENRESISPHVDITLAAVALVMVWAGATSEPEKCEKAGELFCLGDGLAIGGMILSGGIMALLNGPSAIYGYIYKGRCSE